MSKDLAIKVENVSKLYRLGQVGTGTLSHDIKRWWATRNGGEDPYLKIGVENDRTKKSTSDYSWALRNINFELEKGDVLGVIGNNGAGKSTLLKILSRVTGPSEGAIKINGRIASLLEVGTGFHPEMTGRENIFMNGAILGMSKKEIKSKFDDIVEFAGIARYVDTPVKRYSSGMYVRLAFAVAAHLESEILIVDEVLAVGDFEFQKKCLNKMNSISRSEGRTVLFVSHNLAAVQSLCTKAISLQFGTVKKVGTVSEVIADYLKNESRSNSVVWEMDASSAEKKNGYIRKIEFVSEYDNLIRMGDDIKLNIESYLKEYTQSVQIKLQLYNGDENLIATLYNSDYNQKLDFKQGDNVTNITIANPNLLPGEYYFSVTLLYNHRADVFDTVNFAIKFRIVVNDVTGSGVSFLADRGVMWFNANFVNA